MSACEIEESVGPLEAAIDDYNTYIIKCLGICQQNAY